MVITEVKAGGRGRSYQILFAGLCMLMGTFLLALVTAPDWVDPPHLVGMIDAKVIRIIDDDNNRYMIYRVKPGEIFMVQSASARLGDVIRVAYYQRQWTRRVEYQLVN